MLAGEPPFTGAHDPGDHREAVHRAAAERAAGAADRAGGGGPGDPEGAGAGAGRPVRARRRSSRRRSRRRHAGATLTARSRRRRADRRAPAPPPPVAAARRSRWCSGFLIGLGVLFAWRRSHAARRRRRRPERARGAAVREPGRLGRRLLRRRRHRRGARQARRASRARRSSRAAARTSTSGTTKTPRGDRPGAGGRTTCSSARCAGRRRADGTSRVQVSPELVRSTDRHAHDALAAAVRRGAHRRVPGAGRHRGPGGAGARPGPRRDGSGRRSRSGRPEPRGLRCLPKGEASPGPGTATRRRCAGRSATTSRRSALDSTFVEAWAQPSPGARRTTTTWCRGPPTPRPPAGRRAGRCTGSGPGRGPGPSACDQYNVLVDNKRRWR